MILDSHTSWHVLASHPVLGEEVQAEPRQNHGDPEGRAPEQHSRSAAAAGDAMAASKSITLHYLPVRAKGGKQSYIEPY